MNKRTHDSVDGCMTCGHKLCTKKVALFSKLDDRQLSALSELIERQVCRKGETVLRAGDSFDRLYIVNRGGLKAAVFNEEGKEQILYILHEGDSIGELSLLKTAASRYDLVATEDSHLCTIAKPRFDAFIQAHPEVVYSVLESAAEKLVSLEKLVETIASNDADTRLRFLVARLMQRSGTKTPEGVLVELQLTREDMANFVGVTRETISRKLSLLSREGVLEVLEGRRLLVKQEDYFADLL